MKTPINRLSSGLLTLTILASSLYAPLAQGLSPEEPLYEIERADLSISSIEFQNDRDHQVDVTSAEEDYNNIVSERESAELELEAVTTDYSTAVLNSDDADALVDQTQIESDEAFESYETEQARYDTVLADPASTQDDIDAHQILVDEAFANYENSLELLDQATLDAEAAAQSEVDALELLEEIELEVEELETEENEALSTLEAAEAGLQIVSFTYTVNNEGEEGVQMNEDAYHSIVLDGFEVGHIPWNSSDDVYLGYGESQTEEIYLYGLEYLAEFTEGDYELEVILDAGNHVTEENEYNNSSSATFNFSGLLPDLSLDIDNFTQNGGDLTFNYNVTNFGSVGIEVNSSTEDNTVRVNSVTKGTNAWTNTDNYLAAGEVSTNQSYTLSGYDLIEGEEYKIEICSDVADYNSNNNCDEMTIVYYANGSELTETLYSDLEPSDPYYYAIAWLTEEGIVEGYPDGTYQAYSNINRAELAKMLYEGQGITPDEELYNNCFDDVTDEWFAKYVCKAKEDGWVEGYPDGLFRPADPVDNVEAVKMILNSGGIEILEAAEEPFKDTHIDEWYTQYVFTAQYLDLLEEEGDYFHPGDEVTRGWVSQLLYEVLFLEQSNDLLLPI